MHAHTGYNAFKKQFTDACSHRSVHTLFTHGDTCSYASDSILHVDVDKLALCMDMQGTMHLKKQFTDACSHSSVDTLFTHGDTW